MKIAVVNTCVPFIYGGAEFLADGLKNSLIEHGHQAISIRIPFTWYPSQKILEHMLACRLMRFENIDRIVALKFPVYNIDHPDKVVWLLHQFRQAYDLWDTSFQDIPNTPEGLRIRATIIESDTHFLSHAKKIYTISKVVSSRLKRFNGLDSEVVYPPLVDEASYHSEAATDYVFYPSRINAGKRQHLAIESMKYTRSNVRLIIAGNPDNAGDLAHIVSIVNKNHLHDKVKIMGRWISQEEKINLMASALGCINIPYDEDYGYVSLEAYYSRKPVITCCDSGGTLELTENNVTGYVVPAEPRAIAATIDKLYSDKSLSSKMGQAGFEKLLAMNVSWDHVIRKLTS